MSDHLLMPDETIAEQYVVTVTRKAIVVTPTRKQEYVRFDKPKQVEGAFGSTETKNGEWETLNTTQRQEVERVVFSATVSTKPSIEALARILQD